MAVTAVTAAHHELGRPKAGVIHSQQQPGSKSARPGSRDSNYCTNWKEQAQRAAQAAPCMLPAPQTKSLLQPLFTALWSCADQGGDKEQLESGVRYQTLQLQASPPGPFPPACHASWPWFTLWMLSLVATARTACNFDATETFLPYSQMLTSKQRGEAYKIKKKQTNKQNLSKFNWFFKCKCAI